MPRASIVIVNFNSGDRLKRCLAALEHQIFRDFEVIIVDNASSDGSEQAATATDLDVRLIAAGSNLGFAAGNNLAARHATGDWLVFLNPDAYAETAWLDALINASQRYPWADAFGSTQIDDAAPERLDGAGDVVHALGFTYRGGFGRPVSDVKYDGECFSPCAAAAMYRRQVFQTLGGFDERFFCYLEDVDLGFRLRLSGGRAIQVSSARVRHEGSGVTGRYSEFSVYHGNRNRIWMLYKNMPGAFYWPLAPIRIIADLFFIASARGRRRTTLRAVLDGYLGLPRFRRDRRDLQRRRKASRKEIAAALVWSPTRLVDRKMVLRPIIAP